MNQVNHTSLHCLKKKIVAFNTTLKWQKHLPQYFKSLLLHVPMNKILDPLNPTEKLAGSVKSVGSHAALPAMTSSAGYDVHQVNKLYFTTSVRHFWFVF